MPTEIVLELRSLTRNYYDLMDERASYVTAIKTALHTVFPHASRKGLTKTTERH